jgi:hypothetical protein
LFSYIFILGFEYDLVHSYGEGLDLLLTPDKKDSTRSPYTQIWIFCSPGFGELPPIAKDKNVSKIVPFLEAVRDFWMLGGGLFCFFDNEPFTFEGNYLLSRLMSFSDPKYPTRKTTNVRFGGKYPGKGLISVGETNDPAHGRFLPEVLLPPIGQAENRTSLRPGLVKFFEGITIAHAEDESHKVLTTEDELWPFKPFAWTTEGGSYPHPFILYYDPPLPHDSVGPGEGDSPGPVVLHGGFTSAFAEFTDDNTGGTGRLMISIACWLVRIQEREIRASREGVLVKTTPLIYNKYNNFSEFKGWNKKPLSAVDYLFMIDATGSMYCLNCCFSFNQLILF